MHPGVRHLNESGGVQGYHGKGREGNRVGCREGGREGGREVGRERGREVYMG